MIGDSVTMGHGVEKQDTFANQLEQLLYTYCSERSFYKKFQIINAGVQGYSTYQEYYHLRRNLRFSPDFVVLGFCMNDLTEPYQVDIRFGGVGIDYHRVLQMKNRLLSWIFNETGFGRAIRHFRGGTSEEMRRRNQMRARIKETMNVEYMCLHPEEPKIKESWKIVINYLEKITSLIKEKNLPFLIVIFPYTFQIGKEDTHQPQEVIQDFARKHQIDVIDMTEVLEELTNGNKDKIKEYFWDEDHYTPRGNQVIAKYLFCWLRLKNIIDFGKILPECNP
ncbi:SGNH/GDSL hydrolase family protein, partial [Candidatus Sumerlaeota bacterium]|nr:SGNH/GDSL hydrolase family protein [Candidatus Sumerlaeota bacterium]